MTRSLLAVVWTGRRARSPRSPEINPALPLCGKSLLRWSLEKAAALRPRRIIILGRRESIRNEIPIVGPDVNPSYPEAAAALAGLLVEKRGRVRGGGIDVLFLDTRLALVAPSTLRALLERHRLEGNAATALVAARAGGGRTTVPDREALTAWDALIVRGEELPGALAAGSYKTDPAGRLFRFLEDLARRRKKIGVASLSETDEASAVRTPEDASRVRALLRLEKCLRLERRGVILLDRTATWVDWDVRVGAGTIIHPAVVIEGRSVIGRNCRVHPFAHLVDARLGSRVRVLSSTVIESARIGDDAQVGPFTHFRPGTVIRPGARVGNFVEMKNTVFGRRSLACHLSYLGDARVGEDVNIGAGTITCNFDRFKKNPTAIERGAFIGSGTELVAPVRVGRHAVVGAGSTITKDVSPWALAVARGRQVEIKDWARRKPRK